MKLKAYLAEKDQSYKEFAESVGVNASIISRSVRGETMPSPSTVEVIKVATGGKVTADDFHDQVMTR